MKKIVFALISTITLLAACKENFNDGQSPAPPADNKKIVVVSDIHLGDKRSIDEKYGWFLGENKQRLLDFFDYVIANKNTIGQIVFNGDIFDEWVAPMGKYTFVDAKGEETTDESLFFTEIIKANSSIVNKLFEVKQAGISLVYVPGNHDMLVTEADIDKNFNNIFYQARDAKGLGTYTPAGMAEVAIEHSHRYDFFNAPDPLTVSGGILPPGFFVTKYANSVDNNRVKAGDDFGDINTFDLDAYLNSLTQAELLQLPNRAVLEDIIRQLREDLVYWEQNAPGGFGYFDDDFKNRLAYKASWAAILKVKFKFSFLFKQIRCNIPKYDGSYSMMFEILPSLGTDLYLESTVSKNWVERCIQNKVSPHVYCGVALAAGGIDEIADLMSITQYFNNKQSKVRVVVFGHTHKIMMSAVSNIDNKECIYANSGTWIDQKIADKKRTCTFVEIGKKDNKYTVTTNQFGADKKVTQLDSKTITL